MPERPPEYEAYVAAVGGIVHAWNHLHEILGHLFAALLAGSPHVALAIWYSTDNDRAQRAMLRAAVSARALHEWVKMWPTSTEDMLWLIDRANTLADRRNDAIHTPVSIFLDDADNEVISALTRAYFFGHHRAKKLARQEILQEFDWCERYADVLSQFGHRMTYVMERYLRDARRRDAWPSRPSPPDRRPKNSLLGPPRLPRKE
jgi:hypothetical protein